MMPCLAHVRSPGRELKLGVVGVVALLLVIVLIVAVGGEGGFWWQRYPLKARFADVQGLKPGAVVRAERQGDRHRHGRRVRRQRRSTSRSSCRKDVRPLVTTESVATIGSLSLLGEPIIDITRGAGRHAARRLGVRQDAQSTSARSTDLTATASASLRRGRRSSSPTCAPAGARSGKLITDDALYTEMEAFVASAAT